jgi:hypothetical protein
MSSKPKYININLNKLKYLKNDDVMGGAKRSARRRTPTLYTTVLKTETTVTTEMSY